MARLAGLHALLFVAGGNIMHLLESCSRRLTCIPVVHEVAAGIAAEYCNEVHLGSKAFALVTAGPGLTNIVTAIAGAFLESRELLVIGGQVKTADLARARSASVASRRSTASPSRGPSRGVPSSSKPRSTEPLLRA